jgi:hypothetical protein
MSTTANLPLSDRALQPGETDLLGRGAFVRNLATILCNAPKGDSVVFALYGKWGEGKTSTLTLLDAEFLARKGNKERVPVVIRFNPWVFSGRSHLFNAFFEDIGNAIGKSPDLNHKEAAKRWKRLGSAEGCKALKSHFQNLSVKWCNAPARWHSFVAWKINSAMTFSTTAKH